jgi:hypothetical protein
MTAVLHGPKPKSASKELARQQGKPSVEDLELAAEGIDVSNFLCDVAGKKGLKVNFAEAITEGHIERSIEGASLISITVHDGTKEILRSGMFGTDDNTVLPAVDVKVEGLWYRLNSMQKNGEEITLEFEDRIVYYLKTLNKPISASRAHTTRAMFIGRMVSAITKQKVRYFCPELHVKQPIEGEGGVEGYTENKKTGKRKYKKKKTSERTRRAELAGGLLSTTDLTVKGTAANKSQLEVLEEVLDAGSEMGANKKVMLSSLMCVTQESDAQNSKGEGGVNVGPFDQNEHDGWPASGSVGTDAKAYFKQAIANDKANPQLSLQDLVQSVQKSGAGASKYAPWRAEAEKTLTEYGEKGIGAKHGHTYTKEYDFHVGLPDGPQNENYWEASERLAEEVNWRRFVVGNTFYYVSDKDLMARKPIAEFSEDSEGIEEINGHIDGNILVSEAVVKCRATRWFAPPGSVVKVINTGPFNGRWLVFSIFRDLFSTECEIKLHQPQATKPEKAPQSVTVPTSGASESLIFGEHLSGGTAAERIVEAAKWAVAHKQNFTYRETRSPVVKSLFQKSVITDCSGFATLCYKAAGVKDPNGLKYNPLGDTVTLKLHGKKTNTPQPGDLVQFDNPEHVGVYIGEGKMIDFGHQGGPEENPVHISTNTLIGIYTYKLETEPGITPKPSKHGEPSTPVSQQGPEPENNLRQGFSEGNALLG